MTTVNTVITPIVAHVSTFHTRPLRLAPIMWRSAAITTWNTKTTGSSTPLMTCEVIIIWNKSTPGMSTNTAEMPMMAVMMPR